MKIEKNYENEMRKELITQYTLVGLSFAIAFGFLAYVFIVASGF